MDNTNFLDYLIWADDHLANRISKLSSEEVNQSISNTSGSIKTKLIHLAEEYLVWLSDLKSQSWIDKVQKVQQMNFQELLTLMKSTLLEWKDFVNTTNENEFIIDEGDLKVNITLDQAVFNLVNHSSYHRGQIVLFLRVLGYEVEITDFYWYKINQLVKS
ncbi:MAG: DinB family protein [Promethearchaeota archaeon]